MFTLILIILAAVVIMYLLSQAWIILKWILMIGGASFGIAMIITYIRDKGEKYRYLTDNYDHDQSYDEEDDDNDEHDEPEHRAAKSLMSQQLKTNSKKPEERYVTQIYDPPQQHINILKDSLRIMYNTKNPDTFFSRMKLASSQACYCEQEPDIVWNGMTCKEIYNMLSDKKDEIHREFIDRLFAANKENSLTYQLYEVGGYMSEDNLNYFVKRLNGKQYHFCKVGYDFTNKLYTYVTKDRSIKAGDTITVPTGNGNVPDSKVKQVVEVFDGPLDDLPFPISSLRCVESKLKSIVCPHCGASIEISVGQKTGKCTRCQSEFYLIQ